MRLISCLFLLCCFIPFSTLVAAPASVASAFELVPERNGLLKGQKSEFQPSRSKTFEIPFELAESNRIVIQLYSADSDLIRTLSSGKSLGAGVHKLVWDGKDSEGNIVPDEAYIPVLLKIKDGKNSILDDPRSYSGGEIIDKIDYRLRNKTEISYDLPVPSRVLIRAGIRNGPMMRAFTHWAARSAGKVVQRWDGYDKDKVEHFANHPNTWVLVMAYQLPKFSIITSGNKTIDYRSYRKKRGWNNPKVDVTKIKLHREGKRLEREYFLPRSFLPRIDFSFKDELPLSKNKLPVVSGATRFVMTIPKEDRWILESTMYEVSLFIDYEFQGEEEQGFVPIVWKWTPKDIKPGRHIATMQITGYGGYVVAKTIAFEVE